MTVQYKADFLSPPIARIITIVFFGLPPVMTVLVTTLAISRLVLIRKRHISIMGTPIALEFRLTLLTLLQDVVKYLAIIWVLSQC